MNITDAQYQPLVVDTFLFSCPKNIDEIGLPLKKAKILKKNGERITFEQCSHINAENRMF